MNIIVLGPPGSGKGTQARLLAERYGIPHISVGAILRTAAEQKTEFGMQIKETLEKGHFVPEAITIRLIQMRLSDVDCTEGVILDGFPRNIEQAEALDEMIEIHHAIVLDIPDEEAVRRLSSRRVCSKCKRTTSAEEGEKCIECKGELIQRDDDNPETIKERLVIYKDITEPLIEYYKPRNIVSIVNGNRDIKPIFKDIIKILGE